MNPFLCAFLILELLVCCYGNVWPDQVGVGKLDSGGDVWTYQNRMVETHPYGAVPFFSVWV